MNLKKELDQMTFNKNDDIEMFISNMCNIFNKLKDLNEEVSAKLKFNYLYNSLSKEVAQETDIIMFQDKWDECLDSTQKEKPIIWTLDSGASYHMIYDKDHLENTRKCYKHNFRRWRFRKIETNRTVCWIHERSQNNIK